MKWILSALLVLNIGVFGFQYWQSSQPVEAVTADAVTEFNNLQPTANQLQRIDQARASSGQEAASATTSTANLCVRITGLSAEDSLPVVQSRLQALELRPELVTERQVIKTDYQVIMGPYSSAQQAREEMTNVNAKGFESFVITRGDYTNSLSLGLFSNEANANSRRTALLAADFQAEVVKVERFTESSSLLLDAPSSRLVTDSALESIIQQFDNVDFLRFNCN